ncbi:MAG: formimidoylglutamate deiminase, partial [Janthinobacterium lividum]
MSKPPTSRRLFLDAALLPTGWATDVALDVTDGIITAITPDAERANRDHLPGFALPGLPNLHSHTFQRAMAGLTEARSPAATVDNFWTWRQTMYDFLHKLTPEDVEVVAAFAMMQMLEAGFTAVAEFHYLHHAPGGARYTNPAELCERIAAAAHRTGIGLTLLPVLYTHGGFGAQPASAAQARFTTELDDFARLLDGAARAIAPLDDAVLGLAPHSLRAVSPDQLANLPAAPGPIHIHVAEQTREVADCLAWSGQRPVEWLLSHAAVDGRWCLIHATHTDAAERAAMARSGAVAGLCPITEADLGDGLFDAPAFRDAGGLW